MAIALAAVRGSAARTAIDALNGGAGMASLGSKIRVVRAAVDVDAPRVERYQ